MATTTTTIIATTSTNAVMETVSTVQPNGPNCPTKFCLIYHIDPDAEWSDGSQVTGEDLVQTVVLNRGGPQNALYSHVRAAEPLSDHEVMVSFDEPSGAWQSLFGRVFRAGHEGTGIEVLDTTGPFQFAEWQPGDHLTILRDPEWWATRDPLTGNRLGDVREIRFVFIDDVAEMVEALDDGDVDVIVGRPDEASIARLAAMDQVSYTVAPGPFWEHIDFHHGDELLSRPWVREAISLAVDREAILDRTIRLIDPGATALDNTVFMEGTENYEAHFNDDFDRDRAEQILIDHGCSRDAEGTYVCDRIPMSFVWASTNDDSDRQATLESVRSDLAAIGIEIVPDLRSPSQFLTRDFLFGGPDVWQLIDFSWRARPDPIDSNPTYYCDDAGSLNVNRYCSPEIESLVRSTESIVDPVARAAIYNRADRLYLQDRALIPLYQKPTMMAWNREIQGPQPNYTLTSDLWNVASWTGKESIVVALPDEPVTIDALTENDDNANIIMSALVYGAFGMSPSHQRIPLLVESVDQITGSG